MINLNREFERACSAFAEAEFGDLPERDRVLVAIWGIEAEVNNGGFDQFFFNSAGDVAFYAPVALSKIGASEMARIAGAANARFDPEGPPQNRADRQSRLLEITEESEDAFEDLDTQFFAYPDDIAALLVAYLERTASK